MKKYLVIAGWVESKTDRQLHFVDAETLIKLYKVDSRKCFFADERRPETLLGLPKGLKVLRPRYDGDYSHAK